MKKYTYICPACDKPFESRRPPGSSKAPTYCSRECYSKRERPGPRRYKRACLQCGKVFYSKRIDACFCSRQCFGKHRRKDNPRICKYCGREFYVQPSHTDQFCSRECYDADCAEKAKQVCKTCGKEFINQNSLYCSRECWRNRPKQGVWKNCKNCGNEFYVCASHANGEVFCSRDCRLQYDGPTGIEQLIIDELDNRCIDYEFQFKFGRYMLDFAFPEYKLAVEADGVYWHSLPGNVQRDIRKDRALKKAGWSVMRLDGNAIRESPSSCVDKIIANLSPEQLSFDNWQN